MCVLCNVCRDILILDVIGFLVLCNVDVLTLECTILCFHAHKEDIPSNSKILAHVYQQD